MSKAKALRRLVLALHLHLGLWLGVLFALLGITGSALVFYLEIDRAINPAMKVVSAQMPSQSVDAIYAALKKTQPERMGAWRIEMPLTDATPIMARYYEPIETAGSKFAPLMLSLDPNTLAVTSERFWGQYAMTWVYDLHYTLLLDETGHNLVGVLGLLFLVSLLTGLYLWWPSAKRWPRAALPLVRSGNVLRTYDIHVVSGIYAWIVILVLAVTGAMLAFPNVTQRIFGHSSHAPQNLPVIRGLVERGEQTLNLDEAVRIAQRQFPSAEVRWVETSGSDGRPISVRLYQDAEPGRRFSKTYVGIHPVTGHVLFAQDPLNAALGARALAWVHPLHNGEAFGMFGRLLTCVVGFIPLVLLVTGLIRWRQKEIAIQKSNSMSRYQ